jgi:hypothetical protein
MAAVDSIRESPEASTKLADDFNTWWNGKTWSWKPVSGSTPIWLIMCSDIFKEKVETKKPSLMAASTPNTDSDALGNIQNEKEPPLTSEEPDERSTTNARADPGDLAQLDTFIPSSKQSLNREVPPSSTQSNITSVTGPPLHSVQPFFEIRYSPMGGYGAFAIQDIKPYTIILEEPALLEASNAEFMDKFERLSPEDQVDFMSLACFDKISRDKRRATFKTNR